MKLVDTKKAFPALMAGFFLVAVGTGTASALAEGDVVATVDGKAITASDVAFATRELETQLARYPEPRRRELIIRYLVDRALMVKAARAAGIDKTPAYKKRLQYLQDQALRDLLFKKETAVSDADARAFYDKLVAKEPPREEIRARHILVKTEDEAKAIIKELEGGADFAALAKAKSTGPSGKKSGGDLGFFGAGQMIKPFEKAAFALKKGEISKPVKTKFGWHVIKLEDRRQSKPPAFEGIKDKLIPLLRRTKGEELISRLRKSAKIEFMDKKAVKDKKENGDGKKTGADKPAE